VDLEAWETGLRTVVLAAGARFLEAMLSGMGTGRQAEGVLCSCGIRMQSVGIRPKRLMTILGEVNLSRSWFVCPECGEGHAVLDKALDIAGTGFSPGLRRLMARAGSRETFKNGAEDLKVYAEITVTAKDVERIAEGTGEAVLDWQKREQVGLLSKKGEASLRKGSPVPILYVSYDGTGVPMVPSEVAGRKGKGEDSLAKTREVKLGCVFTQTHRNEAGFPVRDEGSTTYVGAIETAEVFGWRIYAEAKRRGLAMAEKVVILADAAKYNWDIAGTHFPNAIWIVDLYHARQHLHALCKALVAEARLVRLETRFRTLLDEGKIERIIHEVKKRFPHGQPLSEAVRKEIVYFTNNKERMRYADFRAQGLFVGSGVIEAGCKTLVGMRLKQSGMEWTVRGANAIIALRCCTLSHRIEDFWEQRTA
jgi:hypothetical protein